MTGLKKNKKKRKESVGTALNNKINWPSFVTKGKKISTQIENEWYDTKVIRITPKYLVVEWIIEDINTAQIKGWFVKLGLCQCIVAFFDCVFFVDNCDFFGTFPQASHFFL